MISEPDPGIRSHIQALAWPSAESRGSSKSWEGEKAQPVGQRVGGEGVFTARKNFAVHSGNQRRQAGAAFG